MKTTMLNSIGRESLTSLRLIIASQLIMLFTILSMGDISAQCHPNDAEEPTVICRDLNTTFMPDTCMVVVWAKDLLTSASDDKTPYEKLIISFDQAGTEFSKVITAEGGLTQIVDIWVTDLCGKQTLCRPKVKLNDNDMNCVNQFDLALIKTVSASSPGPYELGQEVTFDITIFNQGTIDAFNIEITDYIPEGLILNDSDWSQTGDIAIRSDNIAFLAADDETTVQIDFTIDQNFTGDVIVNLAEISGADNDNDPDNEPPVDDDSTPDNEDENDGDPIDDEVDNPEDEDDHDPAEIEIDRYDLAIEKTILTGGPYELGDLVVFEITVTNEGTLDAENVGITDFPDDGFSFTSSNAGNIANVTGSGTSYTILDLDSGESQSFRVRFTIDEDFTGDQLMNIVEITEDDGDDIDSDPDIDKETDDGKDGTVDNDDDDEDMVMIEVDRYDLAIEKSIITGGPYELGDLVVFEITVTNEGTLDAENVGITDFPDDGLVFSSTSADNIANVTGSGTSYTILDLDSGESQSFRVRFTIDEEFIGNELMNIVEITEDDGDDIDSDPDIDKESDDGKDGTADNDDDDEDMVVITVDRYDLSIQKTLSTTGPYELGDRLNYQITVTNEGTLCLLYTSPSPRD